MFLAPSMVVVFTLLVLDNAIKLSFTLILAYILNGLMFYNKTVFKMPG